MNLCLLDDLYSVCNIPMTNCVPDWASGSLVSLTTEQTEVSETPSTAGSTNRSENMSNPMSTLVCKQTDIPPTVIAEKHFRVIRVQGILEFGLVGILSELTSVLASAQVSVFVISTFETDYLLVKSDQLDKAIEALQHQDHKFC